MAASEAVLSLLLTVSGLDITCLNAHGRLSLLPPMLCQPSPPPHPQPSPEGEEPKMAPLLGSLLPSDFININGHDPDTIFFLAPKQPFHSQAGLFNGTATQV
ncbi:hypothetical protein N7505_001246 [Penicillium chrysogenum]|uniref:Uncharacterized protein n=1 Tax=Penicillium chrysogenum TaxID=5076 RepID=A0ABQ8WX42_PENCH|nr:hypothetical protein N7505_001246 [Penicillium chrysogenum]